MGGRGAAILLLLIGLGRPLIASDVVFDLELSADLFAQGNPSRQGWLRIAPRVTRHLSPRVVLLAVPVLEADTHGDLDRARLYDGDDRDPRRALLRFERLSLRFELGAVRLEIGRQPLTWGRTDVINPTDNLTPRDWTDPLHEVRLSPWAVRANVEKDRWEGELALVPRYAPSRLPRPGGRWSPIGSVRVANPAFPIAGPQELEVQLDFGPPELPSTALDNVQAGIRFGRRGRRAEWALSYYRGFDDAPRFDLSVGVPDLVRGIVPVTLRPRFSRLEVAGVDGVLIAGAWALRGEAGYFHFPGHRDGDDGFLLYELDAERTRGSWRFLAGYADVSATEELVGGRVLSGGAGAVTAGAVALDLGFLPVVFVHVGRAQATEWEVSVEAMVGTEEADSLLRVSGSWPMSDVVRLGAEIDLIQGEAGSFFGSWRDNDRLRVFARIVD